MRNAVLKAAIIKDAPIIKKEDIILMMRFTLKYFYYLGDLMENKDSIIKEHAKKATEAINTLTNKKGWQSFLKRWRKIWFFIPSFARFGLIAKISITILLGGLCADLFYLNTFSACHAFRISHDFYFK